MSEVNITSFAGIKADVLKELLNNSDYQGFLSIRAKIENEVETRKNIIAILDKEQRKYDKEFLKIEEYDKRCKYENKLRKSNISIIAGLDEVGRGPLAGPVYTCAVILNSSKRILGVRDSKKLSEKQRDEIALEIKENCLAYCIGTASIEEIDSINILNATKLAMKRAVEGLTLKPEFLLLDALELKDVNIPQFSLIKGDDLSVSIGAASIIAKVERDELMKEFALLYPEYGFDVNKGYGTKNHIDAIKKYGICKIHRKSFVKNFL